MFGDILFSRFVDKGRYYLLNFLRIKVGSLLRLVLLPLFSVLVTSSTSTDVVEAKKTKFSYCFFR